MQELWMMDGSAFLILSVDFGGRLMPGDCDGTNEARQFHSG